MPTQKVMKIIKSVKSIDFNSSLSFYSLCMRKILIRVQEQQKNAVKSKGRAEDYLRIISAQQSLNGFFDHGNCVATT